MNILSVVVVSDHYELYKLGRGRGGTKVNFIKSNIGKCNQCCRGSSHFIHSHMATEKSHVVGVNTSIISFQEKKNSKGFIK